MIEEKTKAIIEYFKDELLGIASNDEEMTVGLKDKKVVIKDYPNKSVEEIIEEIKKGE